MSKITSTILLIVCVIMAAIIYWFLLPAVSVGFIGSVLYFEIFGIIIISLISNYFSETAPTIVLSITTVICILLDLGVVLFGSSLFHADAKYNQLGRVEEVDFDNMITQIDTSQIPIVDYETAKKIADKKLGEEKSLGSRVDLGKGAIQEINGEIMYVFPLEHSGFFKWKKNRTTPGYITVSASNSSKVRFVKGLEIRYQQSAFFGYDLTRYLRLHGCASDGLTEYTFEVSDELVPYWVVTTYKNTICWGTKEATGVVIVNAETGDIQKYSINDTPDWVDVVQPDEFISEQIDNYGMLVHGFFNFSKTDVMKKTDGVLTVYNNGDCYYFTGMTSVGSDDSVIGFMMVNTRTKESQFASLAGATEDAAMQSAEGLVANYGYMATEPLPINENGIPTYAVALKDGAGLIKAYAMINVENYSIGASGSSLAEASTAYMKALKNAGVGYAASDKAYGYTLEGNILRISSEVQNGETVYYFILDGIRDKLFKSTYNVSNELSITQVGDKVNIYYIDDGNSDFSCTEFNNLDFSTVTSENQQNRDILDEEAGVDTSAVDVDKKKNEDWWSSLTEEEKAEIISRVD